MKYLIILLLLFAYPAFGQNAYLAQNKHINGPANVRTTANGEVKLILHDFTDIRVYEAERAWNHITVACFVNEKDVTSLQNLGRGKRSGILRQNSNLYDYKGKVIGVTKVDLEFTADLILNGLLRTGFNGYTHTDNIRTRISKDEILASKEVLHLESCSTKIFRSKGEVIKQECEYGPSEKEDLIEKYNGWKIKYYNDFGWPLEMTSECDYVEKTLEFEGATIEALIRIEKTSLRTFGLEKFGPDAIYNLSIFKADKTERKLLKNLSFYADKLEIDEQFVKLETFGFGGQDESTFEIVGF